jgi:regulator of protease activity HflC (stomatin/prohibitin superfamily)
MFTIVFFFVLAVLAAASISVFLQQKTLGNLAGIAIFAVGVLYSSFTIVPAGHVGVQITLGEVNQAVLNEGAQLVNPISNIKHVDVRLAVANLNNASAGTKNTQQVHTDIVVNYRLTPAKVPHIYKEFGLDVDSKVLGPAINEAFKSSIGHYTGEELITKRDAVNADIVARLSEKLAPFNIVVNNVSLVNFGFSKAFQDSIEAKVIAEQSKLRADQDYERIQVEAKSRIAQAKGEAEAIAIQASAIQHQGGAAYVQLQAIEKWDGKLPNVMGAGPTPFINVGK